MHLSIAQQKDVANVIRKIKPNPTISVLQKELVDAILKNTFTEENYRNIMNTVFLIKN